jgi:transitional endoplasmic reticulum ATPase
MCGCLPMRAGAAGPDAISLDDGQARERRPRARGRGARAARAAAGRARVALDLDGGPAGLDADALRAALLDRRVTLGDRLRLGAGRSRVASVRACEPGPAARVAETTEIALLPAEAPSGPYAAVGGAGAPDRAAARYGGAAAEAADLFRRLGIAPPRGVLFTGPPGSGETLLARAAAQASDAAFFQIDGPEIVSKHYGDSEAKLREVFAAAEKRAPAIVFIDEIDAIAPKRDGLGGEKQLERRVVAQLLTLMDGLSERGQVVVMAATNLPNALDPTLRRPGRFDRELAFTAPDRAGRRAILAVHLAQAPLAGDVDLDAIAAASHGFVGADPRALAREAAMAALARSGAEAGGVEKGALHDLHVTAADFAAARAVTNPACCAKPTSRSPRSAGPTSAALRRPRRR